MRGLAVWTLLAALAWPAAAQDDTGNSGDGSAPLDATQVETPRQPQTQTPPQPPQDDAATPPSDEQVAAGEPAHRDALAGQVRRIKAELRLTGEQAAKFDELLRKHRAGERPRDVANVLADIRQARERGDSDALSAALERLREITQPTALAVFADLAPHLTDEQRPRLERMRQRLNPARRFTAPMLLESLAWLRNALRLTPTERERYDQVALEAAAALDPTARTRDLDQTEVQEIIAELRQALADNDEARIHAVRSRMIPQQESSYDVLLRAMLDIDALVSDANRRALIEYIEAIPGLADRARETRDPLRYLKVARRLELSDEQTRRLDPLEERAAGVDRGNAAVRARQTYEIIIEIFDILSEPDRARFAELFEAETAAAAGGGRAIRAPAPAAAAEPAAAPDEASTTDIEPERTTE